MNVLSGAERKLVRRVESIQGPRYLNLGSGPRGLDAPNWINVDGFVDANVHCALDFSRPLPFANETFQGIFTEHVLEHFTRENGIALFRECKRVLVTDGVLRVILPDANKIIRAYVDTPSALVERRMPLTGLPMEVVNMYAYQRYEHQCLYDWALLRRTLEEAGFGRISQCNFRDSSDPSLAIDDAKYEWESLCVEGRA